MRVLIAIVGCRKRRNFVEAQRTTWLPNVPREVDYRVFVGRDTKCYVNGRKAGADEVFLDVDDSYEGLPEKVKAVCVWALGNHYDFLLKIDDDAYLFPDRFLDSGFELLDYTGAPGGGSSNDFASGFCYCLSAKAMQAVVDYPLTLQKSEDRWVSEAVMNSGTMILHADSRYRLLSAPPKMASRKPLPSDTIACCEYGPADMKHLHRHYRTHER
jgi:hypothetical protein